MYNYKKRKMTISSIVGKKETRAGKFMYLAKWQGWQSRFDWVEQSIIASKMIDEYESKGQAIKYDDRTVMPKYKNQHENQKPFDYDKDLKKNLNARTMELLVDGTKYVFYQMPKAIKYRGTTYELTYDYYICRMGICFNNSTRAETNNQQGTK
jgi:hypothetical protein